MDKEVNQQVQEDPRTELKNLISLSGAYDPTRKYFDIDCIWQDPKTLVSFSKHLSSYVQRLSEYGKINALLASDSVHSPFGCIPIASLVSTVLGIPLLIWKENARIVTNESYLWGAKQGYRVLILHDITRYGLTFLKQIVDLTEAKCVPEILLTIVDGQQKLADQEVSEYLLETAKEISGRKVRFESIFKISDLA